MRYTGIQPQYFPRLHYFSRILNSDVFVVRDEAQFLRKHKYPGGKVDKSYQAHTPVKQAQGIQLLNVPTEHDGLLPIAKTAISYAAAWNADHLKAIRLAYSKAPNFKIHYDNLEEILSSKYGDLAQLNLTTIYWGLLKILGLEKVKMSDLNIMNVLSELKKQKIFRLKNIKRSTDSKVFEKNSALTANEKIVALCRELGVTEDYCGGTGFAAYVDKEFFKKNGIRLTVQNWICRPYLQRFSKIGFIPNLSIIDLLMNLKRKEAAAVISE